MTDLDTRVDVLDAIERALSGADVDLDAIAAGSGERAARAVRRAASIARDARRQRSLTTSVSQFAGAITSVRGADSALQQLVARTRALAGVDMAYLSLNDPGEGRTRIAASDGVWTEAYRTLRMPLGAGVLGRVALAGGAAQTEDYGADDAIVHDDEVDRIVAAEGVRAILGAPLWIDGEVVGALMVANRATHRFDADEIFIVSTLASVAAVAVDNVRRVGDVDAELDAERARALGLERRVELAERARRLDDALLGALTTGGGLHDLREGLTAALGRDAHVVDLTIKYDLGDRTAALGDLERELLAASRTAGRPVSRRRDDGTGATVVEVRRGREAIGAVVVDDVIEGDESPLVERCADLVAAFLVAQDRARGDLAERRRELVEQLVAPPVGGIAPASLTRLAEFGVRPAGPFRLLVAVGSGPAIAAFDHRLELDFGRSLLRAELDGQLIGIVPEAAFQRLEAAVEASPVGTWRGLRIGHSPPLHAFAIIPAELDLVQRVLEAAGTASSSDVLVSLRTYGAVGGFLSRVNLEPTRRAIAELIGALIEWDREQGTPLVETAFAYLDGGHSVAHVAERLHVHKNTVRQRLDRISAILGEGWAEGQRGLDHHIMLATHRILGDVDRPSN